MTSEWPDKSFVIECIIISAPKFRGLIDNGALDPFSLVCKAVSANGQPTVKLSDNSNKAMGPENKIKQYKKTFGLSEQSKETLIV